MRNTFIRISHAHARQLRVTMTMSVVTMTFVPRTIKLTK